MLDLVDVHYPKAALEQDAAAVPRDGADLARLPLELEAERPLEELDRAIQSRTGSTGIVFSTCLEDMSMSFPLGFSTRPTS
jgi:hypothetical protein